MYLTGHNSIGVPNPRLGTEELGHTGETVQSGRGDGVTGFKLGYKVFWMKKINRAVFCFANILPLKVSSMESKILSH